MTAHLDKTARRRHRAALALAGLLVAGLSACSPAEEVTTDADAQSAPPETTSAPAETTSAPAETTSAPAETTSAPETTTSAPAETSSTSEAPAEEAVITIRDFEYIGPESVAPGATVTVVNEDKQAHTVTAKGMFDVTVAPGATGEFTAPQEPGEYDYVCTFHANMMDTLVVS